MAYKFPIKMSFNTRTLINLEEITGKGIGEAFAGVEEGSFTTMMELFAAGANLTLDEAVDAIDVEFEKGLTFDIFAEELTKAVERSSFLKNPTVAKEVSAAKKGKTSKA